MARRRNVGPGRSCAARPADAPMAGRSALRHGAVRARARATMPSCGRERCELRDAWSRQRYQPPPRPHTPPATSAAPPRRPSQRPTVEEQPGSQDRCRRGYARCDACGAEHRPLAISEATALLVNRRARRFRFRRRRSGISGRRGATLRPAGASTARSRASSSALSCQPRAEARRSVRDRAARGTNGWRRHQHVDFLKLSLGNNSLTTNMSTRDPNLPLFPSSRPLE